MLFSACFWQQPNYSCTAECGAARADTLGNQQRADSRHQAGFRQGFVTQLRRPQTRNRATLERHHFSLAKILTPGTTKASCKQIGIMESFCFQEASVNLQTTPALPGSVRCEPPLPTLNKLKAGGRARLSKAWSLKGGHNCLLIKILTPEKEQACCCQDASVNAQTTPAVLSPMRREPRGGQLDLRLNWPSSCLIRISPVAQDSHASHDRGVMQTD